jgi:hypothetical protein
VSDRLGLAALVIQRFYAGITLPAVYNTFILAAIFTKP